MSKMLIISIILFLTSLTYGADGIAAIVGDSIILKSQVDEAVEMHLEATGSAGDALARAMIRQQVLEALVDQMVITVYAKSDTNITLDQSRIRSSVESRIQSILRDNQLSIEELEHALRVEYGISITDYRRELFKQMEQEAIMQNIQQVYLMQKEPTRAEVLSFYEEYKDSLPRLGRSVRLQKLQIDIPPKNSERQEVFDEITAIRERIERGADFSEMAKKYSQCGNGANGGDLGFVRKGSLALINLERAIFSISPGSTSLPIETRIGFHLIHVQERRDSRVKARQIFLPLTPPESRYNEAKYRLDSIRAHATDKDSFKEAVQLFSTDAVTRSDRGLMPWQTVASLSEGMRSRLPNPMVEGAISEPHRENRRYTIYRIYSIDENRPMTPEHDFDQLKNFAQQMTMGNALEELVEEWKSSVFIRIF